MSLCLIKLFSLSLSFIVIVIINENINLGNVHEIPFLIILQKNMPIKHVYYTTLKSYCISQ